jgi:hypothetical protein
MWEDGAKGKMSRFWTGRKRPSQSGGGNVAKREDVRKRISDRNPMKVDEHRVKQKEACSTDEERKRRSRLMTDKNPSTNPVVLAKRVDTYTKRLSEGRYHNRNRWKTGWHVRPDGNKEWYDSSYEQEQMQEYDRNGTVWTKRHGIRIPYTSERGLATYYVPDFLVKDGDKRLLVEIKGWMSPDVRSKALVAIEFCKKNGMKYILLLGKDRKICPEFSYQGEELAA